MKVVLSTACKTTTKGQMHIDLALMFECYVVLMTVHKVEKILKGSLDSIPSPSEKIQIMGGKFAFTTFPPII